MSFLGDEARKLRAEGMSVAEIQTRLGVTKHALTSWLARRPLAKDALRARAVSLRLEGWSVNDIALELEVARSTAWRWVMHLPLDPSTERARLKAEHSKLMTDARWAQHRVDREAARDRVMAEAAARVGELTDRDVLLLGAAIYWCEGTKSKPWRREYRPVIINSDPGLLRLYLGFLVVAGISVDRLTFRLSIHESADAVAARQWWSEELGVPTDRFGKPNIKRHVPKSRRQNVGADYHGCLAIVVARGSQLYWQIEGLLSVVFERVAVTRFRPD